MSHWLLRSSLPIRCEILLFDFSSQVVVILDFYSTFLFRLIYDFINEVDMFFHKGTSVKKYTVLKNVINVVFPKNIPYITDAASWCWIDTWLSVHVWILHEILIKLFNYMSVIWMQTFKFLYETSLKIW